MFVKKVNNDKIRIIMKLLRDFKKITRSDASIAGGKGASLGEMTSAGISVPQGFVVLSSAFEKFLENSDLNVEIDSILHSVNHKEMRTVENASEKIKDLILKAKMPQDIKEEITKEFKKLKSQFVAVRSSATAEDSSSAAWAGQLDSFLNTTEKTLLANVQKCWASLFTPRAIFYRFEKGLHNSKISVAVVIQKMIESEVSGIAFSVHPVTQDRNQMIIEAGYGLGEAVVSGQITPDSYVIEKNPRRIIDKNISRQERGIYRKLKEGGNEWQNIPQDKGKKQKLSDEQIMELSELIIQIENHYNSPQDIEWALEKNKFYITQSRPITTLGKEIDSRPLLKIITREAPLIGVESWYQGIVKETENFFGIKFPENFFIFKRGTVESWRDSIQLEKIPVELSKWAKENPTRLVEGLKRQKATLKLIKSIRNKSNNTEEEILVNLSKIRDSFRKGIPGIVVTYLMPLWQEVFASNKGIKLFDKQLIKQCVEWRKETDPFFDQSIETIFQLLAQLVKVTNWDSGLVNYIRYDELTSALKTRKINKDDLSHRKKSVFAYIDGQLIFEENFYEELAKRGLSLPGDTPPDSKDIKGVSANRGFANGKVKVVFIREELNKVDEGDILIAPMTTPWYMPAMKKAAAIVTDEGGITCHAAIISRELGKPCIIGTKIATKVLHDGDLVEVDADNGVVRILEK